MTFSKICCVFFFLTILLLTEAQSKDNPDSQVHHIKRYNSKAKGFKGSMIFAKERVSGNHKHQHKHQIKKNILFIKGSTISKFTCPCRYDNMQSEISNLVEKCENGLCCRVEFSITTNLDPPCCQGLTPETDSSIPPNSKICLSSTSKICLQNNQCGGGECDKIVGKDSNLNGKCRILPRNSDTCLNGKCLKGMECKQNMCVTYRDFYGDLGQYCNNQIYKCRYPYVCYDFRCRNPPSKSRLEVCENSNECDEGLKCFRVFVDENQLDAFNKNKYSGLTQKQIEYYKGQEYNTKMREQIELQKNSGSFFSNPFANIIGSISDKFQGKKDSNSSKDKLKVKESIPKDSPEVINKAQEYKSKMEELEQKVKEKGQSLVNGVKGAFDWLSGGNSGESKDNNNMKNSLIENSQATIENINPLFVPYNSLNNPTLNPIPNLIEKPNDDPSKVSPLTIDHNYSNELKTLKESMNNEKTHFRRHKFKGIGFKTLKSQKNRFGSTFRMKAKSKEVRAFKICMYNGILKEGDDCYFSPECMFGLQCDSIRNGQKCSRGISIDKFDGPFKKKSK